MIEPIPLSKRFYFEERRYHFRKFLKGIACYGDTSLDT